MWALPCHGQGPPAEPLQSENVLPDSINASPHPLLCTHLVRGPDQTPNLKALLSFPAALKVGLSSPILQARTLRLREVWELAQVSTGSLGRSWDLT